MLIFTRRVGESFQIGSNVTVRVLGMKGGQTKIGIDAPKNVPVHRSEIADRIKNENGGVLPDGEIK